MSIKQLRTEKGLTQVKCAEYLQIPLRTYKRYEANDSVMDPIKHQYIMDRLEQYDFVDETHGILTISKIQAICRDVFPQYAVEYAYLFGSYAKGTATESSDVDLLVSIPIDGLKFYELVEILRERLKKNIDLLDSAQLINNEALLHEILKDGIKIYG